MKPFNLQDALAGKPVITRIGIPIKSLKKADSTYITVYILKGKIGNSTSYDVFTANGCYWGNHARSNKDLFMGTLFDVILYKLRNLL
jgi:hypothetical protein